MTTRTELEIRTAERLVRRANSLTNRRGMFSPARLEEIVGPPHRYDADRISGKTAVYTERQLRRLVAYIRLTTVAGRRRRSSDFLEDVLAYAGMYRTGTLVITENDITYHPDDPEIPTSGAFLLLPLNLLEATA